MILKIRKNYFIFGLVFLAAFFIFGLKINSVLAEDLGHGAAASIFAKPEAGTLFYYDWNNLLGYQNGAVYSGSTPLGSFVPTFLPATMYGPLGIGMEPEIGTRLTIQAQGANNILGLFNSSGVEVFRVKEDGNVGIGTNNPAYKLDILGGNIQVNNGGSATWFGSDATGGFIRTFNGNTFSIKNSAGTTNLFVRGSDGRVGVGTTNPANKLHVVDVNPILMIESGSGQYSQITFRTPYSGNNYDSSIRSSWYNIPGMVFNAPRDAGTGWGFDFRSQGGISRMLIQTNTGNVGIGTTSPATKLTVNGGTAETIDVAGGHVFNLNDNPLGPSYAVPLGYLQDNYDPLFNLTPGGASSTWNISGNNIYNTNLSGNVGIGTDNPQTMLTLGNNGWISSINSSDTGHINMFRVNTNNQIEVGAPLLINQFQFAADSGYNTFVDMPVTAAASLDSVQGYTMKVDGDNVLSIFSQADGSGGTKNRRVGINTAAPEFDLDVVGSL
ncbi:hypothetical protein JXK06_01705, partial [Patescibacteria group bacterium]|nr:hypothetical protein [Patescibacteria group bacterium]